MYTVTIITDSRTLAPMGSIQYIIVSMLLWLQRYSIMYVFCECAAIVGFSKFDN